MPSTITASQPTSLSAQQPATKKPHRPWWRNAADILLCGCLSMVTLECLFENVGLGRQEFVQPDPLLGCKHIPNKLVTWRLEGYSNDRISTSGLRDVEHALAKSPGVTRIALLGDSSTEGLQVPLEKTYARQLEGLLNAGSAQPKYEVINFGVSSFATVQQLLQFKTEVQQYKPDIVVLLYNRGDSVENVFVPGSSAAAQPKPYAYLDSNGKLQIDTKVLKASEFKMHPDAMTRFLRSNSRIYGVFSQAHLSLTLNDAKYRKFVSTLENLYAKLPFVPKFQAYEMAYPPQDALKVTNTLLLELNNTVKQAGGKFFLVMFPNSMGDADMVIQQFTFLKSAEKERFYYFDLTDSFMKNDVPKGSNFLEYHFSAKGHRLVAEQLRKQISALF